MGNGLVFAAALCAVLSKAHLSPGLVGFSVSAALQVLPTPQPGLWGAGRMDTDLCQWDLQGPESKLPTSEEDTALQEPRLDLGASLCSSEKWAVIPSLQTL